MTIGFWRRVKRRGGWLSFLFLSEMFTASAMGHYSDELSKVLVLALFIPLVMSSGGNSGSQATSLIIRAMARGETRLRDWWRVAPREIHTKLGYLPDFYGLYDDLSVRRCLTYAARSHGITPQAAPGAVENAAQRVGLSDRLEKRASELSRGLRQRLAIAQAIVHSPKVLLLDEPAAGLDPQARKELSTLLLSLKGEGMTIVVSSHILAELEDYCSEMIILDHGKVAGGKPIKVREDARPRYLVELATPRADLAEFLKGNGGLDVIEANDTLALIAFTHNLGARAKLVRDLVGAGFEVARFGESNRALEDAYFAQVAREAAQ